MSANGKWDVDIEMSALQDPINQPTMETAAGPSSKFTVRFASILMTYDDEKTWWDAVNDFLVKEGDFAASVSCMFYQLQSTMCKSTLGPRLPLRGLITTHAPLS